MECYQAYSAALSCLLSDEASQKADLTFKNDSIEHFITQCLTNEIHRA